MVCASSLKKSDSRPKIQTQVVHRLPDLPDPLNTRKFGDILAERTLLVSPSGRHLARLQTDQRQGKHLDVIHASRRICTSIQDAVLLWVTPQKILFWGRSSQHNFPGVYRMAGGRVQLLQRLDRLDKIIETSSGPMLQGANDDDEEGFSRFILPHGRGYILTEDNAGISLHSDGRISLIEEQRSLMRHNIWHQDGSLEEIKTFDSHRQVRVLPWCREGEHGLNEGFAYIIDCGDSYVFETAGIQMFDFATRREFSGQIEHFWASPNQKHIFWLVRRPERGRQGCSYRQLYSDGELVPTADGYFQMGPNDLRWSRDGSHYIARLRLHQSDNQGQPYKQNRLITSMDDVYDAPAEFGLQDMAVDSHGRIMFYVLSDGELHYPFFYGEPLDPATYVWNLRDFKKRFSGNRLVGNTIEQFRLRRRS